MPLKCVVLEVHVEQVGPNTEVWKIAEAVRCCLEGRAHFGYKVGHILASNCKEFDHQEPHTDWWDHLLKRVAPRP